MRKFNALVGLAVAGMFVLAGCGGGGGAGGGKAATKGGSGSGLGVTSTSLKGWKVVAGTGKVGPTIDTSVGNPNPPSIKLPGDRSYMWADPGKAVSSFSFDAKTQGLFDFYFGVNDKGTGQMFRIDTRGGSNYAGFAATHDWNDWDAPAAGTTVIPANTWVHVQMTITSTDAKATFSWQGQNGTLTLNGQPDEVYSGTTDQKKQINLQYKAQGTAFGFQGDGLGATSYTWIANLQ